MSTVNQGNVSSKQVEQIEAGELDLLHHVAIQVEEIGPSVAWYREHFHCEVAWEDESWALIRFQNCSLALVRPEQHPPHFAIVREDAANFGPLTPHRDGTASVYLKDLAGNAVECLKLSEG